MTKFDSTEEEDFYYEILKEDLRHKELRQSKIADFHWRENADRSWAFHGDEIIYGKVLTKLQMDMDEAWSKLNEETIMRKKRAEERLKKLYVPDRIEDVVTPFVGYKMLKVTTVATQDRYRYRRGPTPRLLDLVSNVKWDTIWRPNGITATCDRRDDKSDLYHDREMVPWPWCSCGIYAWGDTNSEWTGHVYQGHNGMLQLDYVLVEVEGGGNVLEFTSGWRAEYAHITKIFYSEVDTRPQSRPHTEHMTPCCATCREGVHVDPRNPRRRVRFENLSQQDIRPRVYTLETVAKRYDAELAPLPPFEGGIGSPDNFSQQHGLYTWQGNVMAGIQYVQSTYGSMPTGRKFTDLNVY